MSDNLKIVVTINLETMVDLLMAGVQEKFPSATVEGIVVESFRKNVIVIDDSGLVEATEFKHRIQL